MKKLTVLILVCFMLVGVCACTALTTTKPSNQNEAVKLVVLDEKLAPEEYGIGFRKEDTALAAAVGNALADMKSDGKLAEISTAWFGKDVTIISGKKTEAKAAEIKKIIMGVDDSFPPMGFRDDSGNIVGFDIDLATEVAKRIGAELVVQPIDWSVKEQELSTKKIDVIWNGYTINDERRAQVLFSEPYMNNNQVAVVNGAKGYKTLADLAGKKVGVQSGSSAMDAIKANPEFSDSIELVEFKENTVALLDLEKGGLDAVVLDEIVANYYIKTKNK